MLATLALLALAAGAPSCPRGLTGPGCDALALGPVLPCGAGGLCVRNERRWGGKVSTWTGAVMLGDDGQYHMFGGLFTNGCPLLPKDPTVSPYWLTNAIVVHATSSLPQGPFSLAEVALAPRARRYWDGLSAQSPAIARGPNGEWLLYYIGTTRDEQPAVCNASSSRWPAALQPNGPAAAQAAGESRRSRSGLAPEAVQQRIGLAFAASPSGPWTRLDQPIIGPGPPGAWCDPFYPTTGGAVLQSSKGWAQG